MRREKLGFLLAVTALLAAACGASGGGTPTTGAPIIFGAAVSLTGAQSKEGALTKQGYDLWLDWINQRGGIVVNGVKHPVEIKYEDDQSTPNLSATLVQKLITDEKAQFILGPYGSAATATDAIVAEKNGIPMVEANGAAQSIFSKGYKFTFGVLSPANKYLTGVLDMAATLSPKPTTIAMLTANDVFDGSQWTPQVKYKPAFYLSVSDYVKAYKTKYSTTDDPDYHVAESTAACLAFQKAIENAGSLDATKVRDALVSLDVMTFFGQIKFDSRGINIYKPMVVEQIQNGTHYTVFPTDVANGAPKYPTPPWSSR